MLCHHVLLFSSDSTRNARLGNESLRYLVSNKTKNLLLSDFNCKVITYFVLRKRPIKSSSDLGIRAPRDEYFHDLVCHILLTIPIPVG